MQLSIFNSILTTVTGDKEITHFSIEGRPYDVGTNGRYTWIHGALGHPELFEFTDKDTGTKIYTLIDYVYEVDVNKKPV